MPWTLPSFPSRKSHLPTISDTSGVAPSDPIIQTMEHRAKEYVREIALMKQDRPFITMLGIILKNCFPDEIKKFLKGADTYFGSMSLEECFPQTRNGVQMICLIKHIAPDCLGKGFFGGSTNLKGDHAITLLKIGDFHSNESRSTTKKKVTWLLATLLELPPSLPDVTVRGKDLTGVNLSGLDLESLDLSKMNLSGAKLIGTNLEKANLSGALLCGADLSNANLRAATLFAARMEKSVLIGAILIQADFSYAHLEYADLTKAKLTGAILDATDLSYADLSDADVSEAIFNDGKPPYRYVGAKLLNTNLLRTNFCNADIHNTDLKGANWQKAHWIGVKCCYENIIELGKKQQWEEKNIKSISFIAFSHNQHFNPHGMPEDLVGIIKNNLAQLAPTDQAKKS